MSVVGGIRGDMTSDIAIKVEGLGKRYRIGLAEQRAENFAQAVAKAAGAPFRYLRTRLRKATEEEIIWALRDVSLSVRRGEVVGIIGRNGAGKSTLLKILSRITDPSDGYAEVHGRISSLLEVGTGFHQELTGRENVYLSAAIHGMRKAEVDRKFDEIIDFSGIEQFIDTPVKRYSSGMRVRLGFAVAAHLEPEILLIDEVLAVGDIGFQRKCLRKMDSVSGEGRTVLFVSHQMEAVANLCSRCVLLDEGTVVCRGDTTEVIERYTALAEAYLSVPLRERTDRQGKGAVRFVDTWVENAKGERTTTARTGESMRIVAIFEVLPGHSIRNLTVAFALNTIRNVSLSDLATSTKDACLHDLVPAIGRVECEIPRLPLNKGAFTYNVMARTDGEIQDWVQQAGQFDVEAGDYFGTGKIPDSHRLVLMDHDWRFTALS